MITWISLKGKLYFTQINVSSSDMSIEYNGGSLTKIRRVKSDHAEDILGIRLAFTGK